MIHNNPILEYDNLWYVNKILKDDSFTEKH